MTSSALTPAVVRRLKEKVDAVVPLTTNTQQSGKLYAYVQVALVLLEDDCRSADHFFRAINEKITEAAWNDRPWAEEFAVAYRRFTHAAAP